VQHVIDLDVLHFLDADFRPFLHHAVLDAVLIVAWSCQSDIGAAWMDSPFPVFLGMTLLARRHVIHWRARRRRRLLFLRCRHPSAGAMRGKVLLQICTSHAIPPFWRDCEC